MASGTSYHYTQRGDMVVSRKRTTQRAAPTNYRRFKAIKNLETRIRFNILEDGQPMRINGMSFQINVVSVNGKKSYLTKTPEIIDGMNGLIAVTIKAVDILDIDAGLYQLILTYTDSQGDRHAMFMDQQYRTEYTLEILDNVLPKAASSTSIDNDDFTDTGNEDAGYENESASNGFDGGAGDTVWGLHTVSVNMTGATGTFKVQATLEESPTERDWFDVTLNPNTGEAVMEYTDFTGIDSYVFEGNFQEVRFVTNMTSGTVDKILYRH